MMRIFADQGTAWLIRYAILTPVLWVEKRTFIHMTYHQNDRPRTRKGEEGEEGEEGGKGAPEAVVLRNCM